MSPTTNTATTATTAPDLRAAAEKAGGALHTAMNRLASNRSAAHYYGDGELWDHYEAAANALAAALAAQAPAAASGAGTEIAATVADQTVRAWMAANKLPPMAFDFRGLVVDGIRAALAAAPAAAQPDRAAQERDTLAQAIRDAAVRAGICRDDVSLTGPQLTMLCADMADALTTKAAPAAAQAQPDSGALESLSVAELLCRAGRDSDPVSCFADGSDWDDCGAMALIVKPGHARAVHDLLVANGFITPGKPVDDGAAGATGEQQHG